MWQGIAAGLQDVEERKLNERKMKMAEEQFAESRRNRRLDFLLQYRKSTRNTNTNAKSKADIMK